VILAILLGVYVMVGFLFMGVPFAALAYQGATTREQGFILALFLVLLGAVAGGLIITFGLIVMTFDKKEVSG
jgi:hypothetical protein